MAAHNIRLEGQAFGLRPVTLEDAGAIVDLRSAPGQSRYIHAVSPDVRQQVAWLERYFARTDDYYFIIENLHDGSFEGTIAVYDIASHQGEWGRWVLRPGSMAAPESALLVYRAAFEAIGLEEVYCRTVAANEGVVSFHDSSGLRRTGVLQGVFDLGDGPIDAVEHRLSVAEWPAVRDRLAQQAHRVARLLQRSRPQDQDKERG